MAIIALPDVGWEKIRFRPVAVKATDRMDGRRTEILRQPTTWWEASYTTGFLDRRKFGLIDAFCMAADGDGDYFLAYDVERPRPMAYDNRQPLSGTRAGGGDFDGTATLFDIADSRNVEISGLPEAFTLTTGDYVEFRMSELTRSLHMIMADAVADELGHVALSIRYGLDTQNFTTAATVNFEKPACLMQIEPGSYDPEKSRRSRRPSFSASEIFPYDPEA